MILGWTVNIGITAILIYLFVWFMYKHIIKPDMDKYKEEQFQIQNAINDELKEIKELLKQSNQNQTGQN